MYASWLMASWSYLNCVIARVSKISEEKVTFCQSLGWLVLSIISRTSIRRFLCIPTLKTGQLNPLFHTFAEFRLIVNRIVARQSTDWLAANAQFSPNDCVV